MSDRPAHPGPPSLDALERRAACVARIRSFFQRRSFLEVDTPILRDRASMEPHLVSFETTLTRPDAQRTTLFMHTSPEYAMKQLLAAHRRSIWQIARVFRDEEGSDTHHHEFDMIEWYGVGADYHALMEETEALVRDVILSQRADGWVRWGSARANVVEPFERLTVRDAFKRHAGVDLARCQDADGLRGALAGLGARVDGDWRWEDLFHLGLLELVEPHLGVGRGTLLYDYPARLAALARVRREDPEWPVAERVELYLCGLELSNGFSELTDASEQRARFEAERAERRALGVCVHEIDEGLLEAVAQMPACAGNALGLDRLLMLALGCDHIQQVRCV